MTGPLASLSTGADSLLGGETEQSGARMSVSWSLPGTGLGIRFTFPFLPTHFTDKGMTLGKSCTLSEPQLPPRLNRVHETQCWGAGAQL